MYFLHPWILSGFCVIPLLWWLSLNTPSIFTRTRLPTARFLYDLKAQRSIIRNFDILKFLLHVAIISLVVLGVSNPTIKAKPAPPIEAPKKAQQEIKPRLPSVGIVTKASRINAGKLALPSHYIDAALSKHATIYQKDALSQGVDLIITTNKPSDDMENWMENGGWLLEFAGEGKKNITYPSPQKIKQFSLTSPLKDVIPDENLRINGYVKVDGKSEAPWAVLENSSVFISAQKRAHGVHIKIYDSGDPLKSDLMLSPMFAQILRAVLRAAAPTEEEAVQSEEVQAPPPAKDLSLGKYLILAAFILFLIDGAIYSRAILVLLLLCSPTIVQSATEPPLAYIKSTNNPTENHVSYGALTRLYRTLDARTTFNPSGVVAIAPEDKEIFLYPFVYWEVSGAEKPLTDEQSANIQSYINHGGIIIFDVFSATPDILENLTKGVVLPDLTPADATSTISKTFYKLPHIDTHNIWIEDTRDDYARIIVLTDNTMEEMAQGDEDALRLGINLALYCVTGTYKKAH